LLIAPLHLSAEAFEVYVDPRGTESPEDIIKNGLSDSFQYFGRASGYEFKDPANAYVSSDPTFLATAMVRERRISNWLLRQLVIGRTTQKTSQGNPPKTSGVHKQNFLGKISEEIYDEERTIQRRADYGSVEAG
jgi:hypothetical protein